MPEPERARVPELEDRRPSHVEPDQRAAAQFVERRVREREQYALTSSRGRDCRRLTRVRG
jgi:hypothetical protein